MWLAQLCISLEAQCSPGLRFSACLPGQERDEMGNDEMAQVQGREASMGMMMYQSKALASTCNSLTSICHSMIFDALRFMMSIT